MANGKLIPESQTLEPLAPGLRSGLTAISVLAFISFLSSTLLFTYMSYKLVWHLYLKPLKQDSQQRSAQHRSQRPMDFALGIDGVFGDNGTEGSGVGIRRSSTAKIDRMTIQEQRPQRNPPNQFLLLILNLLLADMHQGVAFLLNAEWLRMDAVVVGTPICFTQGLFISTGDLASSMFITTIAIHTYYSVVKRYRPSHKVLYITMACVWTFVYAISLLPIAGTRNGRSNGGFFVRAGAWVSVQHTHGWIDDGALTTDDFCSAG